MCGQVSCASDSAGLVVGYHQQRSIIWSDMHIFLNQGSCTLYFATAVWMITFFFPPVWPIRTRHGPYNSVSGEKHLEKGLVWSKNTGKSSHQQKQITKQKTQPKRPTNPPARFAFRHKANSEATKNGAGPKQTKPNNLRFALNTVT